MGVLSLLLVAGVFQDGWAHNHGKVDESFFTPWHFILYGTMALNGLLLLGMGLRGLTRGVAAKDALPYGYWTSAVGVIIFIAGGGLDLVWHTLFGVEVSLDALVSPTHLILALGAALVFSGPIRSVAYRSKWDTGGWRKVGPAVAGITAMLALVGFFTQYVEPVGNDGIASVIARQENASVYGSLYAMRADGSSQTRLIRSASDDAFGPSVSPDGRRMVYRVSSNGADASDLYVVGMGAGGEPPRRITHSGRHDTQPAWSPDGKWIAYISVPAGTSGDFELQIVHPDGSGVRTVHAGVTTMVGPAWSPDGRTIAVGSRNGVNDQIELVDVATGTTSWLNGAGGNWPAWSSDGRLYFSTTDASGNRASIDAMTVGRDGVAQHIVAGGDMPAISRDAHKLAFLKSAGGADQIFVADADGRNPDDVSQLSGVDASRPAWFGDRIVFSEMGRATAEHSDYATALSLSGMIVQAIVLVGAVLLLVRRWRAPLGAVTMISALFAIALATQNDDYFAIPAAVLAGVVADVFIASLADRVRTGMPLYVLGFGLPLVLTAGYIGFLGATRGLGWPPSMIAGAPAIAGVAGMFIAFAFQSPLTQWRAQPDAHT